MGAQLSLLDGRTCTGCKSFKPFTQFPKNKNTPTGYHYQCNECNRAKARAWQIANPERERERVRKWKAENADRVLEQDRARRAADPERYNAASREWVRANPAKRKEVTRRSYAKHRVKKAEYARRYNLENRAKLRRRLRRWRAANPHKTRTVSRGKAHRYGAEAQEYIAILLRDPCSYCAEPGPIWLDHITPVSKGGDNGWNNLTAACPTCNMSKNAAPLLRFLARRA